MNDVARDDAVVVRLNPRIDPERLDADDFLLLVAHRAGDVHHVNDECVAFRPLFGFPGEIALVFVDRDDVRIQRIVGAGRDLPFQRFLVRPLEVAQRFGTDLRNLRVMIAFGLEPGAAFGLDARQFEFFGEDLREFLHREIDFEDVRAWGIAGLAVAVFVDVAGSERRAGFAFALADAAGVAAAEAEVGHFDLRDRNADEVLSLLADQFALRDVLLQVLLDLAADDLPEPQIILFDVENHDLFRCAL